MRATTLTRGLLALALASSVTACSFGGDEDEETASGNQPAAATEGKGGNGKKVKIAFSAPAADHGWMAAVTKFAKSQAEQYDDVEFIATEGAADSANQIAQVESLIARDPDVLVILPNEGGALTQVAQQAMEAGIQVVNVDREFTSPSAYRTLIGGDNYGIGFQAGNYIADELKCQGNVVEIQGIAGISVTTDRSKGFTDAIQKCKGGLKVVASQPADFVPDKGQAVMQNILQAQKDIDAVYTHDDDMAQGVVAAIKEAGRDKEMFVTGAGGSKQVMDQIAAGDVFRATFLYNPVMSASAVNLARLIGQEAGLSELREPGVPSKIILPATKVTKENVDAVKDLGF
jgi:ribose transport system substrate-binding protein